jgi:hypothetical protein
VKKIIDLTLYDKKLLGTFFKLKYEFSKQTYHKIKGHKCQIGKIQEKWWKRDVCKTTI